MPKLPSIQQAKSPRSTQHAMSISNAPLHHTITAQHIPALPASIQYDPAALQLPAELTTQLTPSTLHQLQLHLHTTLEEQLRHSLHTLQLHYVKVIQQLQQRSSVQHQKQLQQYKTSNAPPNDKEAYLEAECQRLQQYSIQREVEYQQLKAEVQRLKQNDRSTHTLTDQHAQQADVIDLADTQNENAYPEILITSSFDALSLQQPTQQRAALNNHSTVPLAAKPLRAATPKQQKHRHHSADKRRQANVPTSQSATNTSDGIHSPQTHSQLQTARPASLHSSTAGQTTNLASASSVHHDQDAGTPTVQATIFTITAMDADNDDHIISQRTVSTDGLELSAEIVAAAKAAVQSETSGSSSSRPTSGGAVKLDEVIASSDSPKVASGSPTNQSAASIDASVPLISARRPSRAPITHGQGRRPSVTQHSSDAAARLFKENKELQLQLLPLKQQVKDLQTQLQQHLDARQQLEKHIDTLTNDLNDSRTEALMTLQQLTTLKTTHTEQIEQQKLHHKQKRLVLVTKIKEKDAEVVQLQQLVEIGRTTEANFKGALFHLDAMQKKLKHSEQELQAHLSVHEDIRQLHRSALDTIQQHDSTIAELRNENRMGVRKLKKRLVVKSVWFHSQLIKLERLVEICMSVDTTLAAEFVCSVCLEQLAEPVTLVPCGHSVCKRCCQEPVRNRLNTRQLTTDNMQQTDAMTTQHNLPCRCLQCGMTVSDAVHNSTLESLLSRYTWSSVVLKDARSSIVSTAANEVKTRTMVVV